MLNAFIFAAALSLKRIRSAIDLCKSFSVPNYRPNCNLFAIAKKL